MIHIYYSRDLEVCNNGLVIGGLYGVLDGWRRYYVIRRQITRPYRATLFSKEGQKHWLLAEPSNHAALRATFFSKKGQKHWLLAEPSIRLALWGISLFYKGLHFGGARGWDVAVVQDAF